MLKVSPQITTQAAPKTLRRPLQFESPPARVDQFKRVGTDTKPEIKLRDVLAAQAPEKKDGMSLRKLGKLLSLGLTLGSSIVGAQAYAAAQPPVELVTQQLAQVEPTAIQKVAKEAKYQPLFESLPKEFADHMTSLDDTQMKVLGGGINRKTPVAGFKISNRKAFIKGHFLGHDIWQPMHKSVEKVSDFEQFKLPQESRDELHKAVDMMKDLSKKQRRGLAEVMDTINDLSS